MAIVFISHFLEQVYEIADRITVLRNGQLVGEWPTAELPRVELVSKMLGRELQTLEALERQTAARDRGEREPTTPVLEAQRRRAQGRDRAVRPRAAARERSSASPACSGPAAPSWRASCSAPTARTRGSSASTARRSRCAARARRPTTEGRVLPREPAHRGARRGADGAREHHPRAPGRPRLDAADRRAGGRTSSSPSGSRRSTSARRPEPGRRHAERRQPAEGAARPLAAHRSRGC